MTTPGVAPWEESKWFEIVGGMRVEMGGRGMKGGYVVTKLIIQLCEYAERSQKYLCMSGAGGGFMVGSDLRRPDVALVARDRLPPGEMSDEDAPVSPDLAAEVLSRTDTLSQANAKARCYLEHGVQDVWVVDPSTPLAVIHRPGQPPLTVGPEGTLTGGPAFPGLEVRLSSLLPAAQLRP